MADNILLLPQRKLKKILQESSSFEALASTSLLKEKQDSIPIIPDAPKHNRKKKIRPPSLFESTFVSILYY
jgi:hypothetical protein